MPTTSLRVVFAGGGTGGHVYPGLAVARRLQTYCPGAELTFVGLKGGLEESLLPREGLPLHTIRVKPLKGRSRVAQLGALGTFGVATVHALWLLRRLSPHLVLGLGGYVMGPVVVAAALLRLPRVLMEQNLLPGMTTRVLARYAQIVFTSFPETASYLPGRRVQYTGTPVRQDICALGQAAKTAYDGNLHILILGGSQGAHRINAAVLEALPLLSRHHTQLRMVHQTGTADFEEVAQAYRGTPLRAEIHPFLYDMADRYRWAHLVLCRAGATTLAELTVCGKPAILVPYPYAADDHQRLNAVALQQQGAAQVISDAELTGERLYATLRPLLSASAKLWQQAERSRLLGRPQAADAIVTACLQLLGCAAHEPASEDASCRGTRHAQN